MRYDTNHLMSFPKEIIENARRIPVTMAAGIDIEIRNGAAELAAAAAVAEAEAEVTEAEAEVKRKFRELDKEPIFSPVIVIVRNDTKERYNPIP